METSTIKLRPVSRTQNNSGFPVWALTSTAQSRYDVLGDHLVKVHEPRDRELISVSEAQAWRQLSFIRERLIVSQRQRRVTEEHRGYTSDDPCISAAKRTHVGETATSAVGRFTHASFSSGQSDHNAIQSTGVNSRRQRAFDRVNKRDLGWDTDSDLDVQPGGHFRLAHVQITNTGKYLRTYQSRPSTARGLSSCKETSVSREKSANNNSRPQSAASYIFSKPAADDALPPRPHRPTTASAIEESSPHRARWFRHEEAVLSAFLSSEEKVLLRSYQNIWRAALIDREAALFGSSVHVDEPESQSLFELEATQVRRPFSITEAEALAALECLEHAVLCIRSRELKENHRLGRTIALKGSGQPLRLTDTALLHPATLLRLEIWNRCRDLRIDFGPKKTRLVHVISTLCTHVKPPVARRVPLQQHAALERFCDFVLRIQNIWRARFAARKYKQARNAILTIQRIGAAYLDRRMYLSPLNTTKKRVEDEIKLAQWM